MPPSPLTRGSSSTSGQHEAVRLDARGCTVVPGFVDPHTHLVFAGDRQDELHRRLAGATYETIAAEGGGIKKTVALTRAASQKELADGARPRLDEMLAAGTTTCEEMLSISFTRHTTQSDPASATP